MPATSTPASGSVQVTLPPTPAEVIMPLGSIYTDDQVHQLAAKKSLTLMVYPDSPSPVDVSFDSGATWPMVAIAGQSLTWHADCTAMRFRPSSGTASYSLHGDTV